jgi:hypothetical protein
LYQKLLQCDRPSNGQVEEFEVACREAGIFELSLLARLVIAGRRGGYAPDDMVSLTTAIRALAPGEISERLVQRLAGTEPLRVRMVSADLAETD